MLLRDATMQHRRARITQRGKAAKRQPRFRSTALECLEERCCPSTVDIWLGGAGNYSDAADWSLGIVPNNGNLVNGQAATFTVEIANGMHNNSAVTLDQNATIDNLTIDATNSLTIADGEQFTIAGNTGGGSTTGTITNNGTIAMNGGSANTNLLISGTVTLSGSGSVTMGNNSRNRILPVHNSATNPDTLINSAGSTIQGAGVIGDGENFVLNNQGVIDAVGSNGLLINPTQAVVNTATIEAGAGGTLDLQAAITNTGGAVLATGAGATFQLDSSSAVSGGTLTAASSGAITVLGSPGSEVSTTLSNVTIPSGTTITDGDGEQMVLEDTITNYGTIALDSGGNNTNLVIDGTVTLNGTGSIAMGDNSANRILGPNNPATTPTLNNTGNTIQGAGVIGDGENFVLNNQGMIDAMGTNPLLINPLEAVVNASTIEASAGGTLDLQAAVTNTGGTVLATGAGATFQLDSSSAVTGGTLTAASSGAITVLGSPGSGVTTTLSNVTITSGTTIADTNGEQIVLDNTITNNGTIALDSGGNNTNLVISGTVTLNGAGSVAMGDNTANRILPAHNSAANPDTLINSAGNTIQGAGVIGDGASFVLNNQGVVEAKGTNPLLINPTQAVVNTATIEASAGGTLDLQAAITNSSGTILATGANSAVNLAGATISGGTLTTASAGIIETAGGNSSLSGVTISQGSTVSGEDGSQTFLQGMITNNGTIALDSGGDNTNLVISGTVTLNGSGLITMTDNGANRILGPNNPATTPTLNNTTGNTIQGAGVIGDGAGFVLNNQGLIDAMGSTPLLINPTQAVVNTATIEASAGGTLDLQAAITNTGGTILATGASSVVNVTSNATITGGTLTTAAGGVMQNPGSNATLNGVTISAGSTFTGDDDSSTTLQGTITNHGTIALNSGGNNTNLVISGTVSLTGGGIVTVANNFANRIYGTFGSETLTNVDNTIEGGGVIGDGHLGVFDNMGTVLASQSTPLTIDATTITNEGTYQVNGGSTVAVTGPNGFTQNAGLTTVATNGSFTVNASYNETGGTTTVDGSLTANTVIVGGTLDGNGTVSGPVSNTGTLIPGDMPAPGQLNVAGNYAQNSGGALDIVLGGTMPGVGGFDVLNLSGVATLSAGSILNVSLANGFTPTANETFQFMNYASQTGTFTVLNGLQQGNVTFTVQYLPTDAILTARVATAPTATTASATNITGTAATLNASVNPQGSDTTVVFVYGTDPSLATGTTTTTGQVIGSGTSAVPVTAMLTGLQPGTKYYDEIVATSAGGTSNGSILSFTTLISPSATTQAATDVTTTLATLNASVNPRGSATTVTFVFGTDSTLASGTMTTTSAAVGGGTTAVPATGALSGLTPGTTYYYEVVATSTAGTTDGAILSFTTSTPTATAPTATTQPATAITGSAATLNGSVNPDGSPTTVTFVFGTSSTLTSGTTTTTSTAIGSGTSAAPVKGVVSGLTPGTTYYYEVVATNTVGTSAGAILSFSTLPAPASATGTATNVASTAATLGGSVNPQGSATTVSFVYGTDPTLTSGTTTTAAQSIGSGTSAVAVAADLTGLQPATTYYVRVVATSAAGATQGAILSFTTAPASPPTSPVTVTSMTVTKVKVGTGHHAKKALVLDVHFSGSLSSSAAQELAAYMVYSGKIKKVHKVSQAIYTSFVPLTQAIYVPSADSVLLLPQGKHKLPKLEQLHVNVSLLTDPMGRSINNGKNFTATVTNTGFVLSAASTSGTEKPTAAAVDALFEQWP
jgi:phosphodiesterase/alkaline phosphatase D-like protein